MKKPLISPENVHLAHPASKKISEDQYDKLMRRIWELEQRVMGIERATIDAVSLDMLYDKQRLIEKMIIKLAFKLLPRKKKNE